MRIDHHAYQRATGVAASGLLAQLAIALLLLVFGKMTGDTTTVVASSWAFSGAVVWLGLVIVFYQHRLERLESLEFDAGPRTDAEGRLFQADEARVARKRLGLMHSVLMPVLSVVYAALLVGLGWSTLWWFDKEGDPNADWGTFGVGSALGWQLAVTFGTALLSFIFSRFLAGMAVQGAWANLRGGAGVMVGNALVSLAVGIGTVFEMLKEDGKSDAVMRGIAQAIAIFLFVVAAETLLNFLLNLYRPRRAGETPRPAFDSRVLSLLAAPDSIVRSINEAVNYQFGFDITSSWGYQLLLRNFIRLIVVGVVVILGLTTLVVVQPQQQGIRMRFGALVGGVYEGGPMFKLPWPIDTAEVRDVNRVRDLPLGIIEPYQKGALISWGDETLEVTNQTNIYLVGLGANPLGGSSAGGSSNGIPSGASPSAPTLGGSGLVPGVGAGLALPSGVPSIPSGAVVGGGVGGDAAGAAEQFAAVEADIVLQYRVRNGELKRFIEFSNDTKSRRTTFDMRERALKSIAMREVTRALSSRTLEEVLSPPPERPLVDALAQDIQAAFDRAECGVEVVGLSIPRLRPPGKEGGKFEELSIARQNGRRQVEDAQSTVNTTMSLLVGDVARAEEVVRGIDELRRLEAEAAAGKGKGEGEGEGEASSDARAKADALRARLEQIVLDSRAQAASVISNARALRWNALMDAQTIAAEVTGQVPAWAANPELYRTRRTMEALADALSQVRVKYMLMPDPNRVRLDVDLQETTSGLNLGDYLEKKPDGGN
jgi:regulator of protease activity HflC (stomatin/prohibitin superfamily)